MRDKGNIQKLITDYDRRLQKLKEQKATLGIHTPPHILTETEDIETEIESLKIQLENIDGDTLKAASAKLDREKHSKLLESSPGIEPHGVVRRNIDYAFQAGGILRPDSNTYIERIADREIRAAMQKPFGLAFIWGPPQMGKSSMMMKLVSEAFKDNRRTAIVDFVAFGSLITNESFWYTFLDTIADNGGFEPPRSDLFLAPEQDIETIAQLIDNGLRESRRSH